MPKITYSGKGFSKATYFIIFQADNIISEYQQQGFNLTIRQLYYQFVARGLMENSVSNYGKLGSIINNARLSGLIDWDAIEDRTRNLVSTAHWDSPQQILEAAASGYKIDKWAEQPYRVEVWIEKEALSGVFEGICKKLDVAFFACRGYTSQSEMWRAAMRLNEYSENGQLPVILHFGDHDPSGIDMSRDIKDRMTTFRADLELKRLALNMDQIEEYNPPPNPAKETDSRFQSYLYEFGFKSWELDALEPSILISLVEKTVLSLRDESLWNEAVELEEYEKGKIIEVAENWERKEEEGD